MNRYIKSLSSLVMSTDTFYSSRDQRLDSRAPSTYLVRYKQTEIVSFPTKPRNSAINASSVALRASHRSLLWRLRVLHWSVSPSFSSAEMAKFPCYMKIRGHLCTFKVLEVSVFAYLSLNCTCKASVGCDCFRRVGACSGHDGLA